ncbi:MAG: hypothetical protein A2035_03060 [Nitrospirae bacterium GWA2_42_11]|nr:MAG: hypothetical protein A2035_03060 [Nitrospirae bacterium GWA2_42_11]HAS17083.1 hypothetical protein [Nitrospiraceae bacterium]
MKKIVIGFFIVFLAGALVPDVSMGIEGLSGSTWGQVTYESGDTISGPSAQGYIKQGIDWITIKHYQLDSFASLHYRFRTDNNEYFNTFGPALGIEIKKGPVNIGVQYFWERFTELQESDEQLQFFVNWWYGWDLLKK